MFDKYFKILGLGKGASKEDIKNAYRLLAKKYHPDVSKEKDAHDRFIEISEAYEILINRKVMDDLRATSDHAAEYQHAYEYYTQQAKEKARKASRMRYENLKKEHDAFQKSGVYDVMLLLEYAFNYFLILLTLFLLIFPVYLVINVGFWGLLFLWIPGIFLILYIKGKGRNFFQPGPFFYNISELKQIIKDDSGSGSSPCQYCKNRLADGYPYKISLLKVHDIHLQFGGVMQHRASYKRSYEKLQIPRSKKAYRMHITASVAKVILLIAALAFVPFESYIWRTITGLFAGGIFAGIVLAIAGVRSKVSYLLNINMLVKILVWIFVLVLFSDFSGFPNILSGDYIVGGIMLMLFFQDMLIDPFVKLFSRKGKSLMPLITQPEDLNSLYINGYQPYLDIPVWSTIFPLIKWFI
jgi:hypothetical protein